MQSEFKDHKGRNIEGYWYNEHTEKIKGIKYPMPIANELTYKE